MKHLLKFFGLASAVFAICTALFLFIFTHSLKNSPEDFDHPDGACRG